jgi:hypothetical protein
MLTIKELVQIQMEAALRKAPTITTPEPIKLREDLERELFENPDGPIMALSRTSRRNRSTNRQITRSGGSSSTRKSRSGAQMERALSGRLMRFQTRGG